MSLSTINNIEFVSLQPVMPMARQCLWVGGFLPIAGCLIKDFMAVIAKKIILPVFTC
jgi:hypothetical protein